VVGGATLLLGVVVLLAGRIPWLGKLPGDLRLTVGNISCTVPLATSLLLSLVLTLALNIVLRLWRE
jgi:hypothetical protein